MIVARLPLLCHHGAATGRGGVPTCSCHVAMPPFSWLFAFEARFAPSLRAMFSSSAELCSWLANSGKSRGKPGVPDFKKSCLQHGCMPADAADAACQAHERCWNGTPIRVRPPESGAKPPRPSDGLNRPGCVRGCHRLEPNSVTALITYSFRSTPL